MEPIFELDIVEVSPCGPVNSLEALFPEVRSTCVPYRELVSIMCWFKDNRYSMGYGCRDFLRH